MVNIQKIRVLVADDHPIFREGLCHLLAQQPDIEVVGSSSKGNETARMTMELQPDVVILDVALPDCSGIEVARQIKEVCPRTSVLMMSAYDYEEYVMDSIRAGASGYVSKDTSLQELSGAIRLLNSGKVVFNLKVAYGNLNHTIDIESVERRDPGKFRPRQLEVLKMVAKGLTNKEIGRELSISERTVQSHLVDIFRKLQVSSRTQAVIEAGRRGYICPLPIRAK